MNMNASQNASPMAQDSPLNDALFLFYTFSGLSIVSFFTIIGNALIIQAMVRNEHLRTPSNYFLFSLAVSDLLLGIVYPIYNVSHVKADCIRESLGDWVPCDVILTLTLGLLFISAFNLVGITITRYISIRDPLKFPLHFTHRRALAAISTMWIATTAMSCGIYIRKRPENYENECRYEEILKNYDIIITTCFSVLIPLLVMTSIYIHMAGIARKQIRMIVSQQIMCGNNFGLTHNDLVMRREMRMLKMAGTLVGYFAFAWLPFVVFVFYSNIYNVDINKWIRTTVRIILHSNTAINVAIYAGRLRDFREAIKTNIRDTLRACGLRPKH